MGFHKSLPNLYLRRFLSTFISVASCEENILKVNWLKQTLWSTLGENRLINLAILSTEHEYLKKINLDNIIEKYAGFTIKNRNWESIDYCDRATRRYTFSLLYK